MILLSVWISSNRRMRPAFDRTKPAGLRALHSAQTGSRPRRLLACAASFSGRSTLAFARLAHPAFARGWGALGAGRQVVELLERAIEGGEAFKAAGKGDGRHGHLRLGL